MTSPLDGFRGTLPYASEMFGVYQPLLGWRSRLRMLRAQKEQLSLLGNVVAAMKGDGRVARAVSANAGSFNPDAPLPGKSPAWTRSTTALRLQEATQSFIAKNQRAPASGEWTSLLATATAGGPVSGPAVPAGGSAPALPAGGAPVNALASVARGPASPNDAVHEAVIAGTLRFLGSHAPALLSAIAVGRPPQWQRQLAFVDSLSLFDGRAQQAFLSPIGLVHLYREYFFELDTFLGPPVGHVWVSPGGSLEVFEVHTTRRAEERTVEESVTTSTRTETALATEDDLASAVSRDNNQNTSLGVTASVSGGVAGVYQASASTSFNFADAVHTSQQDSHKQTRQQSQKVASEIRKNFKTTFKTTLEQTDQSSRRYVLSNTTGQLVNYELRRKMRKLGVQVQHIGTQLCWQVYVDNPGTGLGIAELVHIAQPRDTSSSQPPEAPQPLLPQQAQVTMQVPFTPVGDHENNDDDYRNGWEDGNVGDPKASQIVNSFPFDVVPPAAGYTLKDVRVDNAVDSSGAAPSLLSTSFQIDAANNRFTLQLDEVNYNGNPPLVFSFTLTWSPPDQSAAINAWKKALAEYTAEKRRAAHAAYVTEVRARVEAAGKVGRRLADDLRAEERSAVFRRLVGQLTATTHGEPPHVASELVRSVFDVDKMLYFVTPDWWVPRTHHRFSESMSSPGPHGATHPSEVTADDVVGWGGVKDSGRDNYLVTESSQPAPLGASLGWLLQLDADDRRNAFLNTPWVKAVIPIQPGREQAALAWLTRAHVEGTDGLDAALGPPDPSLPASVHTIRDAINYLAGQVATQAADPANQAATERVFENGFDPLAGGVAVQPFQVFDQWLEVLPTDQVVAVPYTSPAIGG